MRGVQRECNPENIYQVLLNGDHDDMRREEGERRRRGFRGD